MNLPSPLAVAAALVSIAVLAWVVAKAPEPEQKEEPPQKEPPQIQQSAEIGENALIAGRAAVESTHEILESIAARKEANEKQQQLFDQDVKAYLAEKTKVVITPSAAPLKPTPSAYSANSAIAARPAHKM
jgi:hypothetical protein